MRLENIVGAFANNVADAVNSATHEDVGISGPSASALALVKHDPGLTIETLRFGLNLTHAGTVRLINRLEDAGLVCRKVSDADKRAVALHLTTTGNTVCRKLLTTRQSVIRDKLSSLSDAEKCSLEDLISRVLQNSVVDTPHAYSVCRLCDGDICENCPVEDGLAFQTETLNQQ